MSYPPRSIILPQRGLDGHNRELLLSALGRERLRLDPATGDASLGYEQDEPAAWMLAPLARIYAQINPFELNTSYPAFCSLLFNNVVKATAEALPATGWYDVHFIWAGDQPENYVNLVITDANATTPPVIGMRLGALPALQTVAISGTNYDLTMALLDCRGAEAIEELYAGDPIFKPTSVERLILGYHPLLHTVSIASGLQPVVAPGFRGCPALVSLTIDAQYSASQVNAALVDMDLTKAGKGPGTISMNYSGMAAPTGEGLTALASLAAAGWSVDVTE